MKYNEVLKCELLAFSANLKESNVKLYFPDGHCCDMEGALEVGKYLAGDNVSSIDTFSGGLTDTSYVKSSDGNWLVILNK